MSKIILHLQNHKRARCSSRMFYSRMFYNSWSLSTCCNFYSYFLVIFFFFSTPQQDSPRTGRPWFHLRNSMQQRWIAGMPNHPPPDTRRVKLCTLRPALKTYQTWPWSSRALKHMLYLKHVSNPVRVNEIQHKPLGWISEYLGCGPDYVSDRLRNLGQITVFLRLDFLFGPLCAFTMLHIISTKTNPLLESSGNCSTTSYGRDTHVHQAIFKCLSQANAPPTKTPRWCPLPFGLLIQHWQPISRGGRCSPKAVGKKESSWRAPASTGQDSSQARGAASPGLNATLPCHC